MGKNKPINNLATEMEFGVRQLFLDMDLDASEFDTSVIQNYPFENLRLGVILPLINFLNFIPEQLGSVLILGLDYQSVGNLLASMFPEYQFYLQSVALPEGKGKNIQISSSIPQLEYLAVIDLTSDPVQALGHLQNQRRLIEKYPDSHKLIRWEPPPRDCIRTTLMYPNGYLFRIPYTRMFTESESVPSMLMILRNTPKQLRAWDLSRYYRNNDWAQLAKLYLPGDYDHSYLELTVQQYLLGRGSTDSSTVYSWLVEVLEPKGFAHRRQLAKEMFLRSDRV